MGEREKRARAMHQEPDAWSFIMEARVTNGTRAAYVYASALTSEECMTQFEQVLASLEEMKPE